MHSALVNLISILNGRPLKIENLKYTEKDYGII